MATDKYLVCPCFECQFEIGFLAEFLGRKIECPHCHQETVLYDPDDAGKAIPDIKTETQIESFETSSLSENSSLRRCKTCGGLVAESCQICVHCGQSWPTINIICPDCGADDFEIEVYQDNCSVWVTPSLLGVLSAAIWESMRSKPKSFLRCLNCGSLFHFPSDQSKK